MKVHLQHPWSSTAHVYIIHRCPMRVKTRCSRMAIDVRLCAVWRLCAVVTTSHLLHWGGWVQAQSAYRDTLLQLSLWPRPQCLSPTTTRTMGNPQTAQIFQCGLSQLWWQSLNTAAMDRDAFNTNTENTRTHYSLILTCFALWTIHISPNALHKKCAFKYALIHYNHTYLQWIQPGFYDFMM